MLQRVKGIEPSLRLTNAWAAFPRVQVAADVQVAERIKPSNWRKA